MKTKKTYIAPISKMVFIEESIIASSPNQDPWDPTDPVLINFNLEEVEEEGYSD